MATAADIQAQLGNDMKAIKIQRHIVQGVDATTDLFYCNGGVGYTKLSKWVSTTNTDSAADQASTLQTGMA